jgi:hypothetical protein
MKARHSSDQLEEQQTNFVKSVFSLNAINSIASNRTNTKTITKISSKFNSAFDSETDAQKSQATTFYKRGLQVYQANGRAAALRSLQSAYPVVSQLLGEENFQRLAHDLWEEHPPTQGDLAQWGGYLPIFLASIPDLQAEPYLSDVATIEWALHRAMTVADASVDIPSFELLATLKPDAITLQLAPATALFASPYPVASILTAHLYQSPSFEETGRKLRQNTTETALVWRQGLKPMVRDCTTGEAALITGLFAGQSLLVALESSSASIPASAKTMPHDTSAAAFNFNEWLPHAVQTGLLLGVRKL